MADVLAARRAYALAHVGTRACDTPRDGATANATMLADALFAPRVAAPEVAREDDDTPDDTDDDLAVLPERERAATLVAEALDREMDHTVVALMLADAKQAYERMSESLSERGGDHLFRALHRRAFDRFQRWSDAQRAMIAASEAERREVLRRAEGVARG